MITPEELLECLGVEKGPGVVITTTESGFTLTLPDGYDEEVLTKKLVEKFSAKNTEEGVEESGE